MLRLWSTQVIYLSAQSTVSYALIIQMTNATHSATLVALVLIALILPPFLLSAPVGALVDRLERRRVLWVSNVLRVLSAALFVLFFLVAPDLPIAIYPLALLFALVGLAFAPAEGALIPTLVDADELLPAFSLYNLTINVTQVIGLLVIGPLLFNVLPTFSIPLRAHTALMVTPVVTLFAGVAVLYLLAAVLVYSLPRGGQPGQHSLETLVALKPEYDLQQALPSHETLASKGEPSVFEWPNLRAELQEGRRIVTYDPLPLAALL
jgi:MFS family permease